MSVGQLVTCSLCYVDIGPSCVAYALRHMNTWPLTGFIEKLLLLKSIQVTADVM